MFVFLLQNILNSSAEIAEIFSDHEHELKSLNMFNGTFNVMWEAILHLNQTVAH